ncbi:hypothetical protein R70723_11810 [Paenibacillus sp. FSL R7-0273]|nr:hypothetical protein R70723_11810 [Paenibacillus sp. FSL R7-0273]OMF97759.1 hypothetical protein BK144_03775 [Paenibacillus sp. FSL R7-0273]
MILNEVISEAEYADIIITLLKPPYEIKSITKIVFIAFCVKNETNHSKYKNRTKDFVDVFFSNISLKLTTHNHEIKQIISVIDKLNKTSKVSISRDEICLTHEFNFQSECSFLVFCKTKNPNPISEVNKLDPKALIEEVLRYV